MTSGERRAARAWGFVRDAAGFVAGMTMLAVAVAGSVFVAVCVCIIVFQVFQAFS